MLYSVKQVTSLFHKELSSSPLFLVRETLSLSTLLAQSMGPNQKFTLVHSSSIDDRCLIVTTRAPTWVPPCSEKTLFFGRAIYVYNAQTRRH
jgi:hypothetical protein